MNDREHEQMTTANDKRPTLVEMFNASAKPDRDLSVHQRVEVWLEAHREWADATPERRLLRSQWRTLCRAYGGDSDVARGVLLGIVRLAWNDPSLAVVRSCRGAGTSETRPLDGAERTSSGGWRLMLWCVVGEDGYERGQWLGLEVDALLAALESAPC